ncbi:hypothetical protein A9Q84_03620 [Halobacteriovorax marinus]|uniref:Uncharacterized protein n=1 Tax=Halobacteriovorax marinus TaxID=97084 RepID=A0A1Y5FA77_9BACT|nr:hypothetical protein A9Q84_03620 [Halobacteriovorax marinus]
MKKLAIGLCLGAMTLSANAGTYQGSSLESVWNKIDSNSYATLPHNKVSFLSLFNGLKSRIAQSANRTLNNKSDILPHFDKLAHPNGTCLKGTWNITEESPYTGFYRNGSKGLIITRASVALSKTTVGNDRAFGFAGKIFPTQDETEVVKTANFFLVDDLGGTKAKNYTGVEMTNEPAVSKTLAVIKNLAYALKLAVTFGKADSNPGIRQVYQISELEEAAKAITPKWMMIKARNGQNMNVRDFRNELSLNNRSQNLFFDIYATSKVEGDKKQWKKLGYIEFTESATSVSCDHNLHFNHPKWRTNLNHK